jgi:hypothetical protein
MSLCSLSTSRPAALPRAGLPAQQAAAVRDGGLRPQALALPQVALSGARGGRGRAARAQPRQDEDDEHQANQPTNQPPFSRPSPHLRPSPRTRRRERERNLPRNIKITTRPRTARRAPASQLFRDSLLRGAYAATADPSPTHRREGGEELRARHSVRESPSAHAPRARIYGESPVVARSLHDRGQRRAPRARRARRGVVLASRAREQALADNLSAACRGSAPR